MLLAYSVNLQPVTALLQSWLVQRVSPPGLQWLETVRSQIAQGASLSVFFAAFSAVPRKIPKQPLALTPEDLHRASQLRSGWSPQYWRSDQVARTLLLLSLPPQDAIAYSQTLDTLFQAADLEELVALYQSLPLLPHPASHVRRATEGIRSNMTVVFNAVALHNPYPAEYADTLAWNQMVLKALFVGSPLEAIQGLDQRCNPELARMAADYAQERWSAGRSFDPMLWRLVGRVSDASLIPVLSRGLGDVEIAQQMAAAIACRESLVPEVRALLTPELQTQLQVQGWTWQTLSALNQANLN